MKKTNIANENIGLIAIYLKKNQQNAKQFCSKSRFTKKMFLLINLNWILNYGKIENIFIKNKIFSEKIRNLQFLENNVKYFN